MLIFPGSLQCLYFNTLLGDPKDKYCLTVCVEPKIRLLLINTSPSALKRSNPDLWVGQIIIDHQRHPFLNQDSYIDCTDMQSMPLESIEDQLNAKPSRVLGKAPDDLIELVRVAIENSLTIPLTQIGWALNALPEP